MNVVHVKYLLVGGGLASASAARAIREMDTEGTLILVGQEIVRPYHRPPLSKQFLRRQKDRNELFVLEPSWFGANDVQLRTGRRVVMLDTSRHAVTLDSGEQISFDQLLLAFGGVPAHLTCPGADLPNVHYVRTLEDVDRLQHAIDKAQSEGARHERGRGRAIVIGAGVLGVELAASLTQMGLAVDLVGRHAHPWRRFAGDVTGQFLARHLQRHGVTLHMNQEPARLEGEGRVQCVRTTTDQTIPCDFVVAAVGMIVPRDLLRGTSIAAEKAILVDDHCRTSAPAIYAAGDCAAVFDPLFGKHRLIDHWDNAQVTGRIAGLNMGGGDVRYEAVNCFFSDVFDLALTGWGEARHVKTRIVRDGVADGADIAPASFIEFGLAADGRISQVLAINESRERDVLPELVRRRINVHGRADLLTDPSRSLGDLLT